MVEVDQMIPEVTLEFIAERLLVIQSEQALMRADMVELKGRFGAIEQHVLAIEQHVIALSADAVNLNRRLDRVDQRLDRIVGLLQPVET
jgi:hypothetical protein